MSDRHWWGPAAAAVVFSYFMSIHVLGLLGTGGPFVKAFIAPGTRALLLGAPLLEPLGVHQGSWLGGMPATVCNLVLVVLYTAAAWWLAWVLGTLRRR